jgi:hypothetical protein
MLKRKTQTLFLFAVMLTALGCQTSGVLIEDSDFSVKQHRIAITAALTQVRAVSQNGREIYSYYHDRNLKAFEVTPKTKERLYTKAVILGARRPYSVSVEVHLERRDPDSKKFQDLGLDDKLSRKRAAAIKQMLNQSREEATTFDEETPF